MGVERDGRPSIAKAMANDEIGNALHPVSAEKRFRDGMTLYAEIEACKQRRRFFGRGRVVTRWSVGRNTHQLAQKIDLFRMVRIDPAGELVVEIHSCASSWTRCALSGYAVPCFDANAAASKCSKKCSSTEVAISASSAVIVSSG